MALANPRVLPPGLTSLSSAFEIRTQTLALRSRAGGVKGVEVGNPYWHATWETPACLSKEEVLAIRRGFWDTMEGGIYSFVAHDFARPVPLNYMDTMMAGLPRVGGGSFTGTASLTSVTAYGLVFGGATKLPPNFVIKAGDYVGLTQSGRYSLHAVVEDATGDDNGILTLNVRPFIVTSLFTTAAVANFMKPLAEFIPEMESWQGDPRVGYRNAVSFSANARIY